MSRQRSQTKFNTMTTQDITNTIGKLFIGTLLILVIGGIAGAIYNMILTF